MSEHNNKTPIQATFEHFLTEMVSNGELKTINISTKWQSFMVSLRTICFLIMTTTFAGFLPENPVSLILAYIGFQFSFLFYD